MKYKLTTLVIIRIKNEAVLLETMQQPEIDKAMNEVIATFKETVSNFEGALEEDPLGRYPGSGLASFRGPSAALKAASQFKSKLSKLENPILVGCAIHTGEVLVRNNAIMGRTLDIVSKLEKITEGKQILFTESVLLSAETKSSMVYHPHMAALDGLSGAEMSIFRLETLGDPDGES